MNLFRKFFPSGQQPRDVEQAREIIERALRESRQPKGCVKSAELGADIRHRLLTVVDDLEKETVQRAVVFAVDGTLTDQRLHEALHKRRDDGELLELSISSCFVNPQAAQYIKDTWPATVKQYQSRPNGEEELIERANILATFVVYNLDAAMEALKELNAAGFGGIDLELTEEQIIKTKVEEAACWYRVVDELAYGIIREDRPLFADHFLDKLARSLALQGVPPDLICRTMAERSKEYAQYREWTTADVDQIAGTLLWRAGKHVGVPVGLERHFMFNMTFGTLFLERVKRALVHQLLTGEERKE
jgi:hypothetical protein